MHPSILILFCLYQFTMNSCSQGRNRGNGIRDLVGKHPGQLLPRLYLIGFQFILNLLDGKKPELLFSQFEARNSHHDRYLIATFHLYVNNVT